MVPAISIIMPAYNAGKYIRQAIDSMLRQSFADFELIIIDDGSTDDTKDLIAGYPDPRIRYLANERNSGLAFTLNRGVGSAVGEYIARMDADDISLPLRLETQKGYLDKHPGVVMTDCIMRYIDGEGKDLGKMNSAVITFEDIVKTLPRQNCLGHSSVMLRKGTLEKYGYNEVGNEDYDLWLRMVSDGLVIHKLDEVLLLYRIHPGSYTKESAENGLQFFRQARTKRKYLAGRIRHGGSMGAFQVRVGWFMAIDYLTACYKLIRNKLSKVFLQ